MREEKTSLEHAPRWMWLILTGVCIFILLFGAIYNNSENDEKLEEKIDKTESSNNKTILPDTVTVYYTLRKGDKPIRVNVKNGYRKFELYGGGKQYYCQPQNRKKSIWGGGNCISNDNPYATYANISYYNEEIMITCKHIK